MELNSSSSMAISNLTLFSPSKVISLGDIIKFSISPSTTKDSLTTNTFGVPLDEKNLVHLDKQVPTGAGLGGGSGNAATALWAANQMNGNIASGKELQAWSAEIGSDCPFFFSQGAAYCTSREEVVRDIAPPIPLDTPMVLIKPKEECSTAEVYKMFSMERVSNKDPEELLREISQNGISQNVCINDLEPPAFEVLPALKALKERVAAAGWGHYQAVFMSGSGNTIVGVGDSEPPQFICDEEQYSDTFISGLHISSLFSFQPP
ncbi:hypothetical protein CY35_02G165600 [Sphagnum magellanicum]|nr:hypothetical protein CY35_02G165600 [Sphagnum magellanicum]